MTTKFDRPRPEIPDPEGTDVKEVYAFFGLCSYYGQVLERGLINLAVVLNVRGATHVTGDDVVAAFERIEVKTLGQLIGDVRRMVPIPDELGAALSTALHDRNCLAHRFFTIRDVDFCSNPGRRNMIEELRDMTARFQATDRLLDSITLPLWEKLGFTQAMMESEVRKMLSEADARESSS